MSVTGFQRRRREIKLKEYINDLNELSVTEEISVSEDESNEINSMTIKEIKELLDKKGIEYNPKEKKEDLIKILEGAE